MIEREIHWPDAPGAGVLRIPDGQVRGGVVALHGAADGRARQPLFDHLARVMDPLGVAVLSYQRRHAAGEQDVPFFVQAQDAVAAMTALRGEIDRPVGVFGFSQGAWAATVAAGEGPASFLIVLGCAGVSPAEQMRFHTDELLRRHGYGDAERDQLRSLRTQLENHLRDERGDVRLLDEALREASGQPWFEHAYLPSELADDRVTWSDMDFDPAPSFAQVRVPVLAMWGTDEECVPVAESKRRWQDSGAALTVADLAGCGHWPVVGSGDPDYSRSEDDEFSPDFERAITDWLPARL